MHETKRIRVALYGDNGHQLPLNASLPWAKSGEVTAYADFRNPPPSDGGGFTLSQRDSLDDILRDPDIDLVSVCSPRRADQAANAIRCMEAGKHVLAEKPCAFTEAEVDAIIDTARRMGCIFHEMAPTVVNEPYATMRTMIADGAVGEVLQVYAQKSYPWYEGRPRDENIDGGLLRQVGIYLYRFVEHIAGVRVAESEAWESQVGTHDADSEARRAVSVMMRLENGGVASAIANYATPAPPTWMTWGYETLRVYGVRGFIESINGGRVARLVTAETGIVDFAERVRANRESAPDFTDLVFREVAAKLSGADAEACGSDGGKTRPPLSLEDELRPTRMVNRAKAAARLR